MKFLIKLQDRHHNDHIIRFFFPFFFSIFFLQQLDFFCAYLVHTVTLVTTRRFFPFFSKRVSLITNASSNGAAILPEVIIRYHRLSSSGLRNAVQGLSYLGVCCWNLMFTMWHSLMLLLQLFWSIMWHFLLLIY